MNSIDRQFEGFRKTSLLWSGIMEGLRMFEFESVEVKPEPQKQDDEKIRLGKLVEEFVFFEFEQHPDIELLTSGLQVFDEGLTVGELDALIKYQEQYIHLEIAYKFYLYDPSLPAELDRWIGPNRRDSLREKLQKLKEKQLPMLSHPNTIIELEKLNLDHRWFRQMLYFKAQLFVPLSNKNYDFGLINRECIQGFYIHIGQLAMFANHVFFIPKKLDWLMTPHAEVTWASFDTFRSQLQPLLAREQSPLCWMKSPIGELSKFFMVWW